MKLALLQYAIHSWVFYSICLCALIVKWNILCYKTYISSLVRTTHFWEKTSSGTVTTNCCVMSSSSPLVRYFVGSRLDGVTPKTMKLVVVTSPLSTQHLAERAKTGLLGIMIMCPSGAISLFVNCCYSEVAQ